MIKVVTDLISVKAFNLTNYETFFLLTAIQLHDIGNIEGRRNHEITLRDVFFKLFPTQEFELLDSSENAIFLDIASAHSGNVDGDKDTINFILPRFQVKHNNENIRVHILAALLRIADELSEDSERSKKYLRLTEKIQEGSEIYHVYAESIASCIILAREHKIEISYKFTKETALSQFNKNGSRDFLLDEIFNRSMKIHQERLYCNKFLEPSIKIDDIDVEIIIFSDRYEKELVCINYEMLDKGYPANNILLAKICRDPSKLLALPEKENYWDGNLLAEYLKNRN